VVVPGADMGWVVRTHLGRFSFITRWKVPSDSAEQVASPQMAEAVLSASSLCHANSGVLESMGRYLAARCSSSSNHPTHRLRPATHGGTVLAGLVEAIRAGDRVALEVRVPIPQLTWDPEPEEPWIAETPSTPPLDWIEIYLVDEQNNPARIEYEVTLADHSVQRGTWNAQGYARIENIPKGQCSVSFPGLDRDACHCSSGDFGLIGRSTSPPPVDEAIESLHFTPSTSSAGGTLPCSALA
jgi:hypothetical protein